MECELFYKILQLNFTVFKGKVGKTICLNVVSKALKILRIIENVALMQILYSVRKYGHTHKYNIDK